MKANSFFLISVQSSFHVYEDDQLIPYRIETWHVYDKVIQMPFFDFNGISECYDRVMAQDPNINRVGTYPHLDPQFYPQTVFPRRCFKISFFNWRYDASVSSIPAATNAHQTYVGPYADRVITAKLGWSNG